MRQLNKEEALEYLGCSYRTLNRMIEKKKLTPTGKGKKQLFSPVQLKQVVGDLLQRQSKHRPAEHPPEPQFSEPTIQQAKKILAKPAKTVLNDFGTDILMETTAILEDYGFLNDTTKAPVLRYAVACQMKEYYLALAHEHDDKDYFSYVKQFQAEIQHYEKELGLTVAAKLKIKPPKVEEKEEDPFEMVMNDNS